MANEYVCRAILIIFSIPLTLYLFRRSFQFDCINNSRPLKADISIIALLFHCKELVRGVVRVFKITLGADKTSNKNDFMAIDELAR